jgi:5-methylcytosine-specific restriction protein B
LAGLPPEEAWTRLRAQFVAAFAAVEARDFDQLDELEFLRHGQALVTKSLAVYFPAEFVPIYSGEHLRHYIRLFGSEPEQAAAAWRLNRQLWRLIADHPVLGGWQPLEVMRFLYDQGFAPATVGETVWKIAPGERARLWDACRDGGFICIGWQEIGDLAQHPTEADLQARLREVYPDAGAAHLTRLARDLLRFRDLPPGARVLANRGQSQVLAVGTVTSDGYRYVPEEEFPNRVGVEWDTTYAQELETPQAAWTSTFAPVSQQLWASIRRNRGGQPTSETPDLSEVVTRVGDVLDRKGQVILHGPPGTGKTRLALDVALALNGNPAALTAARETRADQVRQMLDPPVTSGQSVWLFVANPKQWSWGLLQKQGTVRYRRGRIDGNYERMRPGDLVVGYEATPVKKVIALSRITSVDLAANEPVELQWVKAIDGPTYDEWRSDPILSASEPALHRMQGTAFRLTTEEAALILGDEAPSGADNDVSTVSLVTFHPSYGYEDFVESFKPTPSAGGGLSLRLTDGFFLRVCAAAAKHRDRTYLLIIDEINRADLPRVLGELVTLLEPDKRDVPVVLPVSGRIFRIPPNVKIIGTMNTADRSVAHLDAAVRRRFGFVAVPPDPSVLSAAVGAVDLGRLLDAINERIAVHLDADHALGHSFFLRNDAPLATEADVLTAFYDEVIPLLEDYVIGDHELLATLLGGELVNARTGQVAAMSAEDLLAVLAKEFRVGLTDDVPEA